MALFISLEGGEGSGKTTQVERLADALAELGVPTLKLHEPGYTELGDHIRYLIKSKPWGGVTISPTAELFLFAASRGEMVSKVLTGKIEDPRLVIIADRYADSTIAYQGYGRRLPLDQVAAVNRLATGGLMPHKTFLLDCPPGRGLKRVDVQAQLVRRELCGQGRPGRGQAVRGRAAQLPRARSQRLPEARRAGPRALGDHRRAGQS